MLYGKTIMYLYYESAKVFVIHYFVYILKFSISMKSIFKCEYNYVHLLFFFECSACKRQRTYLYNIYKRKLYYNQGQDVKG